MEYILHYLRIMQHAPGKTPPPFPKEKHWLFGSVYNLRKESLKWFKFYADHYGPIYSISAPFVKLAVTTDPTLIKYILQENSKNFYKSRAYDLLKILLGNGLLTSEGEEWKQHRRMIQPAFHKGTLDDFMQVMIANTNKFQAQLSSLPQPFEFAHQMSELTLKIIAECMFSTAVDEKANRVSQLITLLNNKAIERLNATIPIPPNLLRYFNHAEAAAVKELDEIIYGMIRQRRADGGPAEDLLGMLVFAKDEESGDVLSDVQLRDELMTIFVAGHETTANGLAWAMFGLLSNTEAIEKLRAEIDAVDLEHLRFDQLMQLPYLRAVVDETLRLFPPAWSVGRRNYTDDTIGGFHIAAHTNILIPIIYLHRSEKYWEEPLKFKPERFLAANKKEQDRFVYMPFGAGARMCVGNHFALVEMMIIIAKLFKAFDFQVMDKPAVELQALITLRPKNGVWLKSDVRQGT